MQSLFKYTIAFILSLLLFGSFDLSSDECSSDPVCEECCLRGFWIRGELLFLKLREDGFNCQDCDEGDGDSCGDNGIKFSGNTGFRLGLGYDFLCSNLGASINWTRFNDSTRQHNEFNRMSLKFKMSELDAMISYHVNYDSSFNLRPFIGLRYGRLSQRVTKIEKFSIENFTHDSFDLEICIERERSRFYGAGPLLGFEADFCMGCGFSLYGSVNYAILFGRFKSIDINKNEFQGIENICKDKRNKKDQVSGYDASLGVRYGCGCVYFQLGLEQHAFFDFNKLDCEGDLNLYGINAALGFNF